MEQKRCQFCRKPVRRNANMITSSKGSTEVVIRHRCLVIRNSTGNCEVIDISY